MGALCYCKKLQEEFKWEEIQHTCLKNVSTYYSKCSTVSDILALAVVSDFFFFFIRLSYLIFPSTPDEPAHLFATPFFLYATKDT